MCDRTLCVDLFNGIFLIADLDFLNLSTLVPKLLFYVVYTLIC